MLNDTKQTNDPATTQNNTAVKNDMDLPVLTVEEVIPPMPQVGLPVEEKKEEQKTENADVTNSGSAAPSDDINPSPVVMGTTPKKKFGSGKVIATILGLFLLVGGLGAGTYLVQQNQNIEERAGACGGGCGPGMVCGGEDQWGHAFCVPKGTSDEDIAAALQPGSGGLDNIGALEPTGQNNIGLIGSVGDSGTGSQTWSDWQNVQQGMGQLNNGCVAPAGLEFLCGTACNSDEPGVACLDSSPGNLPAGYTTFCSPTTGRCSISGPACNGTICVVGEYRIQASTGGGGGGGGNNPTPTPPSITASCQNVKAYSSTWTLLTNTELSQLEAGDNVNFCVAGVATGGSFNKARFTINGTLQAETTTVRPSSTDFCQSYVIPAGVTAFNVTAQINHATLGWK